MYPQQFYIKERFLKIAKKFPIIWATFVRNFVAENFQKSHNLVTLNTRANILSIDNVDIQFGVCRKWKNVSDIKVLIAFYNSNKTQL